MCDLNKNRLSTTYFWGPLCLSQYFFFLCFKVTWGSSMQGPTFCENYLIFLVFSLYLSHWKAVEYACVVTLSISWPWYKGKVPQSNNGLIIRFAFLLCKAFSCVACVTLGKIPVYFEGNHKWMQFSSEIFTGEWLIYKYILFYYLLLSFLITIYTFELLLKYSVLHI